MQRPKAAGKGHSLFSRILVSLLAMLAAEIALFAFAISASNVTQTLNRNAVDILGQQVINRTDYIQRRFLDAQDLNGLSQEINAALDTLLESGEVDLETLDRSSEDAQPLLNAVASELVTTIRAKSVNGVFLILSTHDLTGKTADSRLPCIYLRDLDPDATSSDRNADLLVERGTAQTVQQLGITTDKAWMPAMELGEDSFYWEPFQVAYRTAGQKLEAGEYGYWTTTTYTLEGDSRKATAYVQPLIRADGTVYGVVGTELLTSYLEKLLPSTELQNKDHGSYLLAVTRDSLKNATALEIAPVFVTGEDAAKDMPEAIHLDVDDRSWNWTYQLGEMTQFACVQSLSLYNRNAPFAADTWLVIGTVGQEELFAFSGQVRQLLVLVVVAILVVGLLCSVLVSNQLAKPVAQLSAELSAAQEHHGSIPDFSRTGIRELDQFASAITQLSEDNRMAEALERRRIEHERDYDILTGLYNRQAFQRVCENLFLHPDKLGHAALVMTDLDNLKQINDTYGHDWGDQYLRQTGRCFAQSTPPGTLCARLSGDEFLMLFYGYADQSEIRSKLDDLWASLENSVSILPSGAELHISASAGVAWYPENSRDFETLKKYADFAMYQVKHASKGAMKEFDVGMYNQEAYALQTRSEFETMLRQQAVEYHFQPIFSARNGQVVAYEALMRPQMPNLRSPLAVMKLARELNRLYDIEYITFFKASEAFQKLRNKRLIREDALLFLNSVASVSLDDDDVADYRKLYPEIIPHTVVEITEEEELEESSLERKRNAPGAAGNFALDDYGSGYSNGNSLLTIAPRYVKVDISIIRGIDADSDKQQFLSSLVTYAKPRSIQVLAEGVETMGELRKVLELGVDLLQGYGCARPAAVPGPISAEALAVIREHNTRMHARW